MKHADLARAAREPILAIVWRIVKGSFKRPQAEQRRVQSPLHLERPHNAHGPIPKPLEGSLYSLQFRLFRFGIRLFLRLGEKP